MAITACLIVLTFFLGMLDLSEKQWTCERLFRKTKGWGLFVAASLSIVGLLAEGRAAKSQKDLERSESARKDERIEKLHQDLREAVANNDAWQRATLNAQGALLDAVGRVELRVDPVSTLRDRQVDIYYNGIDPRKGAQRILGLLQAKGLKGVQFHEWEDVPNPTRMQISAADRGVFYRDVADLEKAALIAALVREMYPSFELPVRQATFDSLPRTQRIIVYVNHPSTAWREFR